MKAPNRLPTITLDGFKWYVDIVLNELRRVDNPHDRMDICEWTRRCEAGEIEKLGPDKYRTKPSPVQETYRLAGKIADAKKHLREILAHGEWSPGRVRSEIQSCIDEVL